MNSFPKRYPEVKPVSSKCPKCGGKLKAAYMKETCPHCGVNLLYYKLDERLEEDARNAAAEVEKVNRLLDILKRSSVGTPLHIIRLILFFTPLLSMCLPMYRAGNKNVSLIGVIMAVVNHGFQPAAWSSDYLFAVLATVSVIVLSLAVIISSLFSVTRRGFRRNILFSAINTASFGALSVAVCMNGGRPKIGFFLTAVIYLAEILLHLLTIKSKTKKRKIATGITALLAVAAIIACPLTAAPAAAPREGEEQAVRPGSVISFNTAAPWGTPFDDTASSVRCQRFINTVRREMPALIGTQELNRAWLEAVSAALPEYDSYGVPRGGDDSENTSEINAVFWNKEIYSEIETDTFWLSETPDTESRFTFTDENGEEHSAGCNRVCTYAILQNEEDGSVLAFMNTHLDNASEEASDFGATLIMERIDDIRAQYDGIHIILTGDFNQTSDGNAYRTITAGLNDTTDTAVAKATWQDWGYTDTGNQPIDFIFTSGTGVDYRVLDDESEGYVSDHYGIISVVEFD